MRGGTAKIAQVAAQLRLRVGSLLGGSMTIMDLDRRTTITYIMNNMGADILGSERAAAYVPAIYRALGADTPS